MRKSEGENVSEGANGVTGRWRAEHVDDRSRCVTAFTGDSQTDVSRQAMSALTDAGDEVRGVDVYRERGDGVWVLEAATSHLPGRG